MIGQPITRDVDITSTNVDQDKGGVTSQRVTDLDGNLLLAKIYEELQKMNTQLAIITGEEL